MKEMWDKVSSIRDMSALVDGLQSLFGRMFHERNGEIIAEATRFISNFTFGGREMKKQKAEMPQAVSVTAAIVGACLQSLERGETTPRDGKLKEGKMKGGK
jgi:hypothetical protein